jgi:hypothetical protein
MYEFTCKYCKEVIYKEKKSSFAGHVKNCEKNPNREKGYKRQFERSQKTKKKKQEQVLNNYYNNPSECKNCNNVLEFKKKQNKFCSSNCAASYNNKLRDVRSEESKNKTRATILKKLGFSSIEEWRENKKVVRKLKSREKVLSVRGIKIKEDKRKYLNSPKKCLFCDNVLTFGKRKSKFCDKICLAEFRELIKIKNGAKEKPVVLYKKRKVLSEEEFYSKSKNKKTYESYLVHGEKARKSVLKRYKNGWDSKCGRSKKYDYDSSIAGKIKVDGTWELKTAKFFDKIKVKWIRNTRRFEYFNGESISTYKPDFYVFDWDCYIEVKGCKTTLDLIKWKQFPCKLQVWEKEKLQELKILER